MTLHPEPVNFRRIGGPNDLDVLMEPHHISAKFGQRGAMVRIAHGLMSAWDGFPVRSKAQYDYHDVRDYINSLDPYDQNNPERAAKKPLGYEFAEKDLLVPQPRNADRAIHTPWRDAVYKQWNHVFMDVITKLPAAADAIYKQCNHIPHAIKYLPAVADGVVHMHPPRQDVLPISRVVVKKLTTNLMFIPTYIKEGLKINIFRVEDGQDTYLGQFTPEEKYDCWFIWKGTEVKFEVEGEETPGLDALLMLGILCDEKHA